MGRLRTWPFHALGLEDVRELVATSSERKVLKLVANRKRRQREPTRSPLG